MVHLSTVELIVKLSNVSIFQPGNHDHKITFCMQITYATIGSGFDQLHTNLFVLGYSLGNYLHTLHFLQ